MAWTVHVISYGDNTVSEPGLSTGQAGATKQPCGSEDYSTPVMLFPGQISSVGNVSGHHG